MNYDNVEMIAHWQPARILEQLRLEQAFGIYDHSVLLEWLARHSVQVRLVVRPAPAS